MEGLPEGVVGLVFGPSSNTEFSFTVNPDNIPKFGEYVMAENRDGEDVLGIVKEIVNFNKLIMDESH
ncbi:ATP-binding protein, partial [Archaeoglobales archaeon]